jgi:hypothetical protein
MGAVNSPSLFVVLEIQYSLKLYSLDFLERLPGDALKITVHADGGLHDAVDLFFALGPLAGDGFLFAIEIFSHGGESFDDGLHALAKARPGEILVNHFHLGLLAFGSLANGGDFDQCLA